MQQELERIYRHNRQGLFTLALAITRCPERAQDAVQGAFTRLWQLPAPPNGQLLPYVFAAVRNAATDEVRRRGARGGDEELVSIFDVRSEEPGGAVERREEAGIVRLAVDCLPDAEREAVVMKIYGGLTFRQIAEVVGAPLPTVASRYQHAMESLRAKLGRML